MIERLSSLFTEYSEWLPYLAFGSIAFLIVSILLIPKIIAKIPHDYFSLSFRKSKTEPFTIIRLTVSIIKNFIGSILIVSGLLMLVLPGQGLLTLFVGFLLLNFPGKYKLERYLIKKPAVRKSLNWIRRKQNVAELSID